MVSDFEVLGLHPALIQTITQLGFEQPTPIQQAAIPALLAGRNVIGQAQTGTGKTAAFALPLLQQIQPAQGAIQALVMTPTRELAIQVAEATGRMAAGTAQNAPIRVMAVYGGQSYQIQIRQIKRGVEVVVGTPGRLLDLIRQEVLDLSQVRYLVLDEADEMLDMGFIEDVEAILAEVPGERQIALFSATLPAAVRRLADRYLSDPHEITINPTHLTVPETEQSFCRVHEEDKLTALTHFLEMDEVKSALIFARTKARTQELADELVNRGYSAESLHGDLSQSRREFVLQRFRKQAIMFLVATDVAARGLDIEDISHVFNFDVPMDPEDYIHRIGRTGRAGRKGIAITFLAPRETHRLKKIEAYTRQPISECRVPTRKEILARRDERFLQRLTGLLHEAQISHERALVQQLVDHQADGSSAHDLIDIAAAAIRMARSAEGALPQSEIQRPVEKPKPARTIERGLKLVQDQPRQKWQPRRDTGANLPRQMGRGRGKGEPGMVRLLLNLGNAHGLRPGDVVGAIASEVGIPGRAIGEIDIHRDHTYVDVAEEHVRRILRKSDGRYSLRGKPVLLKLAS